MRLQVVGAADPRVGHHRGARAGLDRCLGAVGRAEVVGAVEGVLRGELVTQLVGHVVDVEDVPARLAQAGAAARGVVAAGDAEPSEAAAVGAEGQVPDVVRRRADEVAQHQPGATDGGQPALVEHPRVVADGLLEAGGRPAGPVLARGLGGGVEVEPLGVLGQHEADAEVVVVDLVDPGHQRDLGGQHVLGAPVVGVRRVVEQRQPVGAPHDLSTLRWSSSRSPLVEARAKRATRPRDGDVLGRSGSEVSLTRAGLETIHRDDVPSPTGRAGRLDDPLAVPPHRGGDPQRGDGDGDGLAGVLHRATGVRRQLGVPGGQPRLHDLDRLHVELDALPARGRQLEHVGPQPPLHRPPVHPHDLGFLLVEVRAKRAARPISLGRWSSSEGRQGLSVVGTRRHRQHRNRRRPHKEPDENSDSASPHAQPPSAQRPNSVPESSSSMVSSSGTLIGAPSVVRG